PEDLDQYLQVNRPSTWMVLGAIIILLVGFCVWGFMGKLTTTVDAAVVVDQGNVVCYITEQDMAKLPKESLIQIADSEFLLKDTGLAPIFIDDNVDISVKLAGNLMNGMVVYPLSVDADLPDGIYVGKIQIESVKPASFIMN
ncbi:MAG: hypothetical protein KBS83_06630, partial [Lachnospiraceae bacterium]|nr:hypothetical protein [Candidatus Equihabitans merdae]